MAIRVWLAALVVAVMPAVASAVTVMPGATESVGAPVVASGSFLEPMASDSPVTFAIKATEAMRVMVVGTALPTLFDLVLSSSEPGLTTAPGLMGSTTFGQLVNLAVDEVLTISFGFSGATGGGGQVTFTTSPIPLPAAGWMLISALGGMAVLARRRKAVA
jgi:hypothetical protein